MIHCSEGLTFLSRDDVRFTNILAFAGKHFGSVCSRKIEKVELEIVGLVVERPLLENVLLIHRDTCEFLQWLIHLGFCV